jgi:hypothetical protein
MLREATLEARRVRLPPERGGDDALLARRRPDMLKGGPPDTKQRTRQDERQRGQPRGMLRGLVLELGRVLARHGIHVRQHAMAGHEHVLARQRSP